ncbi:WxL protein peptidoglycan domain-containing protein [Dactylosporangium sp. CA-139066]|uniref:WxL protein peptidoglycan domain-containing protein n=1 Tax=Dactylosporangium sp. CA-139066 TaxID=3239930 RepID=UPI003D931AEE
MTTPRHLRRASATSVVVSLLVAAAITLTGGPAGAAPTPTPTPSAPTSTAGGVDPAPPGSIRWSVQPAGAQGPDGRKEFSYRDIKPGTVVHDYVAVTNFSAMPVTFQLYATDALNGNNGALQLQPAAEKPKDVGAWVQIMKTSVTLKPNERANEPITLTIPDTATPGDHTGGILASIGVEENSANGPVKVDRRLGVPLYLRVAGPLSPGIAVESVSASYHGSPNPFSGGSTDVTLTVHNTGNVRLNVSPEVVVKGLYWLKVAGAHPTAFPNLLPGSSTQITVHLDGVFPLGPMTVRVKAVPSQITALGLPLAETEPKAVETEAFLWATPWPLLLLIVLLVGGYFGVRWLRRTRRGRQDRVVAAAVAKARKDTVEELKKKALAAKAADGDSGASG